MPPVNKEALGQKFRSLNSSQQAIEAAASNCVFYKHDAKQVVGIWESEFTPAAPALKLSLLYLANHLLQESRKKAREFVDELVKVLPKAMRLAYKTGDEKLKKSVLRLLDIWDDRKVIGSAHMKAMREVVMGERTHASGRAHSAKDTGVPPALVPLAEATHHVEQASQRTSEAMNKSMKGIRSGLVQDGTPAELHAGLELMSQYGSALEGEIEGRQRVVALLRTLMGQQEDAIARNTDNLNMCKIQRENVERRLALITGSGGGMGLPPSHMPPTGIPPPMPPPMTRPQFSPPAMMGGTGVPPAAGAPYAAGGYPLYGPAGGAPPHSAPHMPHPTPPPFAPPAGHPAGPPGHFTNGSRPTPPPHHSPSAPRPDSPMPPPLSPADGPETAAPSSAPAPAADTIAPMPILDADMLASLAEKLANSDQSATLLAQALESLPADERAHLSVNVSQVMAGVAKDEEGADGGDAGAGDTTPVAPDMEDDDAPYDPEYPD